jgi:hypothetical protein
LPGRALPLRSRTDSPPDFLGGLNRASTRIRKKIIRWRKIPGNNFDIGHGDGGRCALHRRAIGNLFPLNLAPPFDGAFFFSGTKGTNSVAGS